MDEMYDNWDKQLDAEIQSLVMMEPGSQEKALQADVASKMYKTRIDEIKSMAELEAREAEVKAQRKDRIIGHILDGAKIVLPLAFAWIWMGRGLEFEKEGTYTSQTFKGLWNRFNPLK